MIRLTTTMLLETSGKVVEQLTHLIQVIAIKITVKATEQVLGT
jgi:hypothetical protein